MMSGPTGRLLCVGRNSKTKTNIQTQDDEFHSVGFQNIIVYCAACL